MGVTVLTGETVADRVAPLDITGWTITELAGDRMWGLAVCGTTGGGTETGRWCCVGVDDVAVYTGSAGTTTAFSAFPAMSVRAAHPDAILSFTPLSARGAAPGMLFECGIPRAGGTTVPGTGRGRAGWLGGCDSDPGAPPSRDSGPRLAGGLGANGDSPYTFTRSCTRNSSRPLYRARMESTFATRAGLCLERHHDIAHVTNTS